VNPFEPRPLLKGGHRMTLYSWADVRHFPLLPPATLRYFDVDHDTRVVAHCHWQPRPWEHRTIIALHGLNGSSDAHYMKGIAAKGFARGLNVVRLNQRNCGDTEHLSAGLFHSGLTADALHVLDELTAVDGLREITVAGYSLGGNLALKLAGDCGARAPESLTAVAAVSPILEIGDCVRALERPGNMLYEWNFVRGLKRRMRRKERFRPGRFDLTRLDRIRTVREFDDAYTAPFFGFAGADDYYHRASAMRVVDRIGVPALIIAAEDDPFVPASSFLSPNVTGNPNITVMMSRHGGHCGFVGPKSGGSDGYWAEDRIVEFVASPRRSISSLANAGPLPLSSCLK
jgi:predicted alpha/beta-fold hydrolase